MSFAPERHHDETNLLACRNLVCLCLDRPVSIASREGTRSCDPGGLRTEPEARALPNRALERRGDLLGRENATRRRRRDYFPAWPLPGTHGQAGRFRRQALFLVP